MTMSVSNYFAIYVYFNPFALSTPFHIGTGTPNLFTTHKGEG